MADLDTAAKRKSAVGVSLPWLRMGVIPDGSDLSAPQRLHAQALYSGIASGGSTPTSGAFGIFQGAVFS